MPIDYVLDTNIFISLFNNRLAEEIPDGKLGYSVITAIELLSFSGLSKADDQTIRTHLKSLQSVPLDRSVCEKTILLRRQHKLKTPDAIVVASAWVMDAVLLTSDQQLLSIEQVTSRSLICKEFE